MNKALKIVIPIIAVIAIIGASVGVHLGYSKTTDELKSYTVDTQGEALKVGVISDLQMPNSKDKDTHQYKSFESTLTMLKNKGMDALVIAGDFTDLGTKDAWGAYKEIYDKVMADSKKPIPIYAMGNHDYWLDYFTKCGEVATPAKMQKRFTKYTGEYPLSHKVINGYHFIVWSSLNGSYDKCNSNEKWIRAELDKAVADDPNKPIFVITHLNPTDTAYGSDEWGNDDIANVLKDYSQVISLSGHVHYSLIDERSIWQGEFTAIQTQSLDYIELENGKFNGSIPVDAYGETMANQVPSCLYMEIEENKVTMNRLEANTGRELKEPWIIEAPFDSSSNLSKYSSARTQLNQAPTLDEELNAVISDITAVDNSQHKMISFKAGSDDDFVHSYKLEFQDKNHNLLEFQETDYEGNNIYYDAEDNRVNADTEGAKTKNISQVTYFSDFTLGLNNMSETVELRLPKSYPENAEYVVITAIDSWGAESNSVVCKLK